MNNIAIYCGSFDPPTLGHFDIIKRSLKFCNKLYVVIGNNSNKSTLFSLSERIGMLNDMILKDKETHNNIIVDYFENKLLVDYARTINANILVRGIRSVSDFEYEINLAGINKKLYPYIETLFIPTSPELVVVSSSAVKEIAKYGGNISNFVTDNVAYNLKLKFPNER